MNPLPTQYELATLAAAIPIHDCWKDDEENAEELVYRANRAFDLWQICGGLIADAPTAIAAKEAQATAQRDFDAQFPPGERVSLKDFLKFTLPDQSLEKRNLMWGKFRTVGYPRSEFDFSKGETISCSISDIDFSTGIDVPGLAKQEQDAHLKRQVDADRSEGLPRAGLKYLVARFERFLNENKAWKYSKRASSGGLGKDKNEKARALEKANEQQLKVDTAEGRKGRGYSKPKPEPEPEPELEPEVLANKVVVELAKIQELKKKSKKLK